MKVEYEAYSYNNYIGKIIDIVIASKMSLVYLYIQEEHFLNVYEYNDIRNKMKIIT